MISKMHKSLAIASVIALSVVVPANAAVTFLDHLNSSSSFNINPANGDYAAGSGTATVTGSPGTGPGYFTGSSPANLAYHSAADGQTVEYSAYQNVQYTGPSSGGITIGAWVKMSGLTNAGRILQIGSPHTYYDYLRLDFGNGATNTPRVYLSDQGNYPEVSGSGVDITDWNYIAVTMDLTNQKITIYDFDKNGLASAGSGSSVAMGFTPDVHLSDLVDPDFVVQVGGQQGASTSDIWIDEVSVDSQVLSASEMQARVDAMVAGNQMAVPEPATLSLLGLGGLLLIRRRRA
jgi:hypothetical protein